MRFFRVWTHRNPDSIFGPASSPVIRNGSFLCFESEEKARAECDRLNAQRRDMQVHYTVEPTSHRGLAAASRGEALADRGPVLLGARHCALCRRERPRAQRLSRQ